MMNRRGQSYTEIQAATETETETEIDGDAQTRTDPNSVLVTRPLFQPFVHSH
jgi:hypothetical protein